MKNIIKETEEIKRMQKAIKVSKSNKLKSDYNKAIYRKLNDLKEYCIYRNIDFSIVLKEI